MSRSKIESGFSNPLRGRREQADWAAWALGFGHPDAQLLVNAVVFVDPAVAIIVVRGQDGRLTGWQLAVARKAAKQCLKQPLPMAEAYGRLGVALVVLLLLTYAVLRAVQRLAGLFLRAKVLAVPAESQAAWRQAIQGGMLLVASLAALGLLGGAAFATWRGPTAPDAATTLAELAGLPPAPTLPPGVDEPLLGAVARLGWVARRRC